jgi:hypothetical protein
MAFINKANFTNKKRVICEVHREMYDIILTLGKEVALGPLLDLLEEANTMAKKMSGKLFEYHYEENKNYDKSLKLRKDRALYSK